MTMSTRLTAEQKQQICKHKALHPLITQKALAAWAAQEFSLPTDISQPAITKILQKREQYEGLSGPDLLAKRPRTVNFPKLEEALSMRILQCQGRKVPINSAVIRVKGRNFARDLNIPDDAIKFSNGWLHKFQQRHKMKAFKIYGESGSTNSHVIEAALPDLRALISRYARHDVYNMDETGTTSSEKLWSNRPHSYGCLAGLFYSMALDRTIAQRQIEGIKKDKSRIKLAFTANADGSDKLPPFFIGHASKPRCFNKKAGEQLGFYYRNNKKAWMTGIFFQEWLNKLINNMTVQLLLSSNLLDEALQQLRFPSRLSSVTSCSCSTMHPPMSRKT